MEYIHTVKKYTVLLTTEEVLECDSLKVLYDAVRRRIRWGDEKFTAYFYKNINWWGKRFRGKDTFLPDGNGVIRSLFIFAKYLDVLILFRRVTSKFSEKCS